MCRMDLFRFFPVKFFHAHTKIFTHLNLDFSLGDEDFFSAWFICSSEGSPCQFFSWTRSGFSTLLSIMNHHNSNLPNRYQHSYLVKRWRLWFVLYINIMQWRHSLIHLLIHSFTHSHWLIHSPKTRGSTHVYLSLCTLGIVVHLALMHLGDPVNSFHVVTQGLA